MYVLTFYTPENNAAHHIGVHIGRNAAIERFIKAHKVLERAEAENGKGAIVKYNETIYVSNSRAALVKKAKGLRDEYVAGLEEKIAVFTAMEIK